MWTLRAPPVELVGLAQILLPVTTHSYPGQLPIAETAANLIVEDDSQLRHLYRATLVLAGFDVDQVADGLDALRLIEEQPPDLVVLDLRLPGLDGVFVHQEIAAREQTRKIPIVVVTGDPGDLVERDNLCILRKPVDPDASLATVRRCLRNKGLERS